MKHRIFAALGTAAVALTLAVATVPGASASSSGSAHRLVTSLGRPAPDATVNEFAGYQAPVQAQSGPGPAFLAYQSLWVDQCPGMPDGTTYTEVHDLYASDGSILEETTTHVICVGGLANAISMICWRGEPCSIIWSGEITHNGWEAGRAAPGPGGHGAVVTVTNPESGKTYVSKDKKIKGVAGVGVGFLATDQDGNPIQVGPFPPIQFSTVMVGGKPLADASPKRVILYQNGVPVAAPTSIGSDGESFMVQYVGP